MPRPALFVGVALILAACATPQEQCIAAATRDLAVLDRLIAEAEGNLARGYAIGREVRIETRYVTCRARPVRMVAPDGTVRFVDGGETLCLRDIATEVDRPVAIDLEDEGRKVFSMKRKRGEMAGVTARAVVQCRAVHPK